jgi:hypothetical protein
MKETKSQKSDRVKLEKVGCLGGEDMVGDLSAADRSGGDGIININLYYNSNFKKLIFDDNTTCHHMYDDKTINILNKCGLLTMINNIVNNKLN